MEDGGRPAMDATILVDEVERLLGSLARSYGNAFRHFLKRTVVDRAAGHLPPTLDPAPAKVAIAVEDNERFCRRVRNGESRHCAKLRRQGSNVHWVVATVYQGAAVYKPPDRLEGGLESAPPWL